MLFILVVEYVHAAPDVLFITADDSERLNIAATEYLATLDLPEGDQLKRVKVVCPALREWDRVTSKFEICRYAHIGSSQDSVELTLLRDDIAHIRRALREHGDDNAK